RHDHQPALGPLTSLVLHRLGFDLPPGARHRGRRGARGLSGICWHGIAHRQDTRRKPSSAASRRLWSTNSRPASSTDTIRPMPPPTTPDTPAPSRAERIDATLYLHPQTLARLGSFELRAKMIVEGVMSGAHRSPYQGFSVEFAQHRPYAAGDDLRHLDWKVYGRSDKLYPKQYQQETNLD